jgi:hypothetical protein
MALNRCENLVKSIYLPTLATLFETMNGHFRRKTESQLWQRLDRAASRHS